jgi:hypothetical protein
MSPLPARDEAAEGTACEEGDSGGGGGGVDVCVTPACRPHPAASHLLSAAHSQQHVGGGGGGGGGGGSYVGVPPGPAAVAVQPPAVHLLHQQRTAGNKRPMMLRLDCGQVDGPPAVRPRFNTLCAAAEGGGAHAGGHGGGGREDVLDNGRGGPGLEAVVGNVRGGEADLYSPTEATPCKPIPGLGTPYAACGASPQSSMAGGGGGAPGSGRSFRPPPSSAHTQGVRVV